eukprot:Skav217242  [mRNA]  locus=scaffold110:213823:223159:+ [translate_table: standard]
MSLKCLSMCQHFKERGLVRAVAVVISIIGFVLAALQSEEASNPSWCPCCRRRRRIVVLAERPVREMQGQVRLHFRTQDPQGAYKRLHCVSYREGCKSHRIELMKVCASVAEHILIMCSSETDSSSDHEARASHGGTASLGAIGGLCLATDVDLQCSKETSWSCCQAASMLQAGNGVAVKGLTARAKRRGSNVLMADGQIRLGPATWRAIHGQADGLWMARDGHGWPWMAMDAYGWPWIC